MRLYRTPLKAKAIPKLVAKALSALDALPGAEDMDIIPEAICAHYSLMPWHQVSHPMPCRRAICKAGVACVCNAVPQVSFLQLARTLDSRERYGNTCRAQAVRSRHVPGSQQEAEDARSRLAFEELLVLQLRLLLQRTSIQCAERPCLA